VWRASTPRCWMDPPLGAGQRLANERMHRTIERAAEHYLAVRSAALLLLRTLYPPMGDLQDHRRDLICAGSLLLLDPCLFLGVRPEMVNPADLRATKASIQRAYPK